jgi:hypothetical protein
VTTTDRWPTPQQLVGVWATAMTQAWTTSLDWWKVMLEGGTAEDTRLTSWSTTCDFELPPPEGTGTTHRCTSFAGLDGAALDPGEVEVRRVSDEGLDGGIEIQVETRLPATSAGSVYRFTIGEVAADGQATGRERTYLRGFGVPGS